jgi:tetratricopeptide (TPR) repeat protein
LILRTTFLYILLIGMFLTAGSFNNQFTKPIQKLTRSQEALNFSSLFLKIFSFGNRRFYSSIIWTHTLLSGDLEHYKKSDLNSWMYHRFNVITDLDPKFYQAYLYGGRYLSIIKDDLYGAEAIFLKGLNIFPDDYWLIYYTAFNYYFELNDKDNGIRYYKKLISHPDAKKINPGLSSLLAGMVARQGNFDSSIQILQNAINSSTKPKFKERFENLIKLITIEKDLECLNNKGENCKTIDPLGRVYYQDASGVFQSRTKRRKFKQKKGP